MSRKRSIPSYCLHKASGQAVVRINGRDHYLGAHGSPQSYTRYAELVARLASSGEPAPSIVQDLTVSELLLAHDDWAQTYYQKAGRPTRSLANVRRPLALVRQLFGSARAADFGPLALDQVRRHMISLDWARRHINQAVGTIRRTWKWAAARQLVPLSAYQALMTLDGLRAGKSQARESAPVGPAPEASIQAALAMLRRVPAAMLWVQLLTGARAGEVCAMRAGQLERTGDVWLYRPATHKTAHLGRQRLIPLGPRAVALIEPWLPFRCPLCGSEGRRIRLGYRDGLCGPCADRAAEECLCGPWPDGTIDGVIFSPRQADLDWRQELRARRRSKVQPSQEHRRKRHPRRPPGEEYRPGSYNSAIRRACLAAGVPPFHSHQLRHSAATRLRAEFGIEVARAVLGHSHVGTTEIYALADLQKAIEAMRRCG